MRKNLLKKIIALSISSLLISHLFADTPAKSTNKTMGKTMGQTISKPAYSPPLNADSPVPLNQYGAVDLNANVPLSAQVPPKPNGFVDPSFTILSDIYSKSVPVPPSFTSKSYLLMDANTGAVIAANNPNTRLAPASITKLMLLYIAEQNLATGKIHLDDLATVPPEAWATGGSRMFLKPGTQIAIKDLIPGIIVDSGNDAAVTLAVHIAGTQEAMVNLMNQEAVELGMTNTHFSDVMGLPVPRHYSTAYDLALLGKAIVTQYPQYISWYGQKWFTYNNIKQPNFNKLLFIDPNAIGLKTGSTSTAGYSLVSAADNKKMQLIGVVLNTPSDDDVAADSKALLTYGFNFFETQKLYSAGQILDSAKTYFGKDKTTEIGLAHDLYVTIPQSLNSELSAKLILQPKLEAPLLLNQTVGEVDVLLNNQIIETFPAVVLKANPSGNLWRRVSDQVSSWF